MTRIRGVYVFRSDDFKMQKGTHLRNSSLISFDLRYSATKKSILSAGIEQRSSTIVIKKR